MQNMNSAAAPGNAYFRKPFSSEKPVRPTTLSTLPFNVILLQSTTTTENTLCHRTGLRQSRSLRELSAVQRVLKSLTGVSVSCSRWHGYSVRAWGDRTDPIKECRKRSAVIKTYPANISSAKDWAVNMYKQC